jgi:DNA-binding CsgD family transcriptional regulator/PAS domain-containing protein
MLEEYSATIERLYAAACDASRWTDALSGIEELSRSAGAVVHLVPKTPGGPLVSLLGVSGLAHFPAEEVAEWTRDFAEHCPRLAAAPRFPNASFICDRMILSEREMDRDPVYQWYAEHGLRYFIGSTLHASSRVQIVWSLQRTRNQGHVQQAEVALFERLKPHLARALALADQLGTLRSHQSFSSAVLEAMPQALFALDDDGRILFANSRAEACLRAADGLCLADGRLSTALASEQPAIDRLIKGAGIAGMATGSGWARVSRPRGGLPYAMFVSPLRTGDDELLSANAKVLVIVHDTAQRRGADLDMLAALFGLTDAEARLASALSAGHSLESAAAMLGIRQATARTELKSVFRKAGVSRQQDLVRLLTSLSSIGPA